MLPDPSWKIFGPPCSSSQILERAFQKLPLLLGKFGSQNCEGFLEWLGLFPPTEAAPEEC